MGCRPGRRSRRRCGRGCARRSGKALFAAEHGREAADAQELSGFVNRASRVGSKAVAGFDLTFSPVKSVSALWALADPGIAREIAAAHDAAVAHTMAWLERTAAFTRLGRDGVRQVEVARAGGGGVHAPHLPRG